MKFFVDVNLPRKFSFFNSDEFIHVADINPTMKDGAIWEYAKSRKLTILTKDTDFFHRAMLDDHGPVVVYFKLGNTTLSDLHSYFLIFWPIISASLHHAQIITAFPDRIEVLSR